MKRKGGHLELQTRQANQSEKLQRLLSSLESFTQDLGQRGILIRPWSEASAAKFLSCSPEQQEKICSDFESYSSLVRSGGIPSLGQGASNGPEAYSEKDLLKVCAQKLQIRFHENVFNKMTNQDIVEIYDINLVQIYRNIGFFNLCSYSLLDLLSYEFYALYERSLQVNSWLMEAGRELYRKRNSFEPLSLQHIPKHFMREIFSEEKFSFMIEFKEMYPVYTCDREFYGYLMVQGAEKIPRPEAELFFI